MTRDLRTMTSCWRLRTELRRKRSVSTARRRLPLRKWPIFLGCVCGGALLVCLQPCVEVRSFDQNLDCPAGCCESEGVPAVPAACWPHGRRRGVRREWFASASLHSTRNLHHYLPSVWSVPIFAGLFVFTKTLHTPAFAELFLTQEAS